jgi:hypothetical protein
VFGYKPVLGVELLYPTISEIHQSGANALETTVPLIIQSLAVCGIFAPLLT